MDEKKVREAIEAFRGQVDWLKRIDDKGCEESRRCCIEYFETAIEALEMHCSVNRKIYTQHRNPLEVGEIMNEIERVVSYIKSCREAGIDCTVTIDKSKTHIILNALEKQMPKNRIKSEGSLCCPICKKKMEQPGYCECGQLVV